MTYIVPDYNQQTAPFDYRLPGWQEDVSIPSYNHLPTRQTRPTRSICASGRHGSPHRCPIRRA